MILPAPASVDKCWGIELNFVKTLEVTYAMFRQYVFIFPIFSSIFGEYGAKTLSLFFW